MTALFDRFMGRDSAKLEKIKKIADQVLVLEPEMRKLSDTGLPEKLNELKSAAKEKTVDELLPETFALVRETARRVLGEHPFPVQVMGGIILHQGNISEMKTGEGKTLVSTMPIVLNALYGKGVHLVTANEYLAKRDADWMGKIYQALGLSVGVTAHGQTSAEKRAAYASDITYGTNNEFGFDYLRDNMAYRVEEKVQRELQYAIVDEVDSILIDEARTPLIISAPDEESSKQYAEFARIAPQLEKEKHYEVDEKERAVTLTDEGISRVEKILGVENIYGSGEVKVVHHLEQALRAMALYKRDVDYVVKEGEVMIVDSFTGRLMPGRRYSEGLHQAIEAKEGVKVQQESRTMATITFQNYFRLYKKLAGMTGTAKTSEEEFQKVYNLDVLVVPTNKNLIRNDQADRIYRTELGKFRNVVKEIKERNKAGQPVLVGTVAIEKSELLSNMLIREGVKHEVLNAKNHAREAEIVANAGQKDSVTISTNMAGRGTDIKLGEGVREVGGLHIIGTERHEARRIDNQLRGRAGRQGDPGSSQFFISAEDDVMRIFGADRMKNLLTRFNIPEDEPIESRLVSKAVESAQARVEGFYFDSRKHVLDYDDVMNKQREAFYRLRNNVLETQGDNSKLRGIVTDLLSQTLDEVTNTALIAPAPVESETEHNVEAEVKKAIERLINLTDTEWQTIKETIPVDATSGISDKTKEVLHGFVERHYDSQEERTNKDPMFYDVIRSIVLRALDFLWTDHLDTMEYLRTGIGLRGYGQRDPLVEYRREGHQLFQNLMATFRQEAAAAIFHLDIHPQAAPRVEEMQPKNITMVHPDAVKPNEALVPAGSVSTNNATEQLPAKKKPTIGRNDPCFCGSGKKYKKCHGK
ncbi:MAG: preprotein translocase subunit SecA [bacterium]|nr:preprotein translocase subunit SecA [bacterium]